MKLDDIHDALNFIDDDLLEPVAKLRKVRSAPRFVIPLISLAACLCIIIVGVVSVYRYPTNTDTLAPESEDVTDMTTDFESAPSDSAVKEDLPEASGGYSEPVEEGVVAGDNSSGNTKPSAPYEYTVTLKVTKVTSFGFYATVTKGDKDLATGDTVTVRTEEKGVIVGDVFIVNGSYTSGTITPNTLERIG